MNSKEEQNIDNLFKERLGNYEAPVQEGSFDVIFNKANIKPVSINNVKKLRKEKYKNFIPYLAAAVLVGIILSIGLFFHQFKTKGISVATPGNKSIARNSEAVSPKNTESYSNIKNHNITSDGDIPIKIKKNILINTPQILKDHNETLTFSSNTDIREVILPDSSIITLNKYSTISYSKDYLENRKTALIGEAFFTVKKNLNKPFRIECVNSVVTVLGTSFNVKSNKNETEEISVVTGRVSVESKITRDKNFLSPGDKILLNKRGDISKIPVDFNTLAWQTNELNFQKELVKNVLPTMESYFSIKINVQNQDIMNCTFTGKFVKPTINEFFEIFSSSLNLSYQESEKVYSLNGNGCK